MLYVCRLLKKQFFVILILLVTGSLAQSQNIPLPIYPVTTTISNGVTTYNFNFLDYFANPSFPYDPNSYGLYVYDSSNNPVAVGGVDVFNGLGAFMSGFVPIQKTCTDATFNIAANTVVQTDDLINDNGTSIELLSGNRAHDACTISGMSKVPKTRDWWKTSPGLHKIHCTEPFLNFQIGAGALNEAPIAGLVVPAQFMTSLSVSCGGVSGASVSVRSVRPAQVVYNPTLLNSSTSSFDVVLNKSMSFEVTLTGTNTQASNDSVKVQVVDPSGLVLSQSLNPIPVNAIGFNGLKIPASAMTTYIPQKAGFTPITVQLLSAHGSTSVSSLSGSALNVVKTYAPSIGLIPMGECLGSSFCYGDTNAANLATLLTEKTFMSDVFPVADNSLVITPIQSKFHGQSHPYANSTSTALGRDIAALKLKKMILGLSRIVAMVTKDYLSYQNYPITGATGVNFGDVSFVREDTVVTLPHEILHSFGSTSDYYDNFGNYNGPSVEGYNARTGQVFSSAKSLMGPDFFTFSDIWIDPLNYLKMFSALSTTPIDPPVILVAGVITRAGAFSLLGVTNISNGSVTVGASQGDIAIQGIDANGKQVSSILLASNFSADVEYQLGYSGPRNVDIGEMPINIAFPADKNIQSFQVLMNGKLTTTAHLNAGLLLETIDAIPENAFKVPCENNKKGLKFTSGELKQTLLKEAEGITGILNSKNPNLAVLPLVFLIKEIKLITYENYSISDPTELTQVQVISNIEGIINPLNKKFPINLGDVIGK